MRWGCPSLILSSLSFSDEQIVGLGVQMLELLNGLPWNNLGNRRVQHYGYEFVYGSNIIDMSKPIQPIPSHIQ